MIIYTRNAEDYITALLGVCGEVDQDLLLARAPVGRASIYRAIKNLKSARVLIRHRYDDGKRYLRLSSVGGAEALGNISPAVAANIREIVNDEIKYTGSKAIRIKERNNSALYMDMLMQGIEINGFSLEHEPRMIYEADSAPQVSGESIFDGGRPALEDVARGLTSSYTGLFTRRLVKNTDAVAKSKGSKKTSRISGTLFLNGKVYQAYTLGDPESSAWLVEAENASSAFISGTIERTSPAHKSSQINNRCILFFETEESASKMLSSSEDESYRIDPCRIYEASYIRPSYSLNGSISTLLGIGQWETLFTRTLFPNGEESEVADLVLPDGTEVYNFIGANLNKTRYVRPRIMNAGIKAVLLIEPWMSPVIHKVFDIDTAEIVSISDEDLGVIANALN